MMNYKEALEYMHTTAAPVYYINPFANAVESLRIELREKPSHLSTEELKNIYFFETYEEAQAERFQISNLELLNGLQVIERLLSNGYNEEQPHLNIYVNRKTGGVLTIHEKGNIEHNSPSSSQFYSFIEQYNFAELTKFDWVQKTAEVIHTIEARESDVVYYNNDPDGKYFNNPVQLVRYERSRICFNQVAKEIQELFGLRVDNDGNLTVDQFIDIKCAKKITKNIKGELK